MHLFSRPESPEATLPLTLNDVLQKNSYLNDISINTEQIEDSLAVELVWSEAVDHQHA